MFSSLKGIWDLISLLKKALEWFIAEQNRQIGRDQMADDITRKTAETENAMRDVHRPPDDDVARSLQDGKF